MSALRHLVAVESTLFLRDPGGRSSGSRSPVSLSSCSATRCPRSASPTPISADIVPSMCIWRSAASMAMQDAWMGDWPSPLHLAVLAGSALGLGVLSARLFRWE